MKRTDDPDERFEWDMTTVMVLVFVIMLIGLIVVSLGLPRSVNPRTGSRAGGQGDGEEAPNVRSFSTSLEAPLELRRRSLAPVRTGCCRCRIGFGHGPVVHEAGRLGAMDPSPGAAGGGFHVATMEPGLAATASVT